MLLENWAAIECDLQDIGIDVGNRGLLRRRDWRWLRTRIIGLCSADTRLARALDDGEGKRKQAEAPNAKDKAMEDV